MVAHHFSHVRHWVFDLDNTLYPPAARLFDQIEARMTEWVMAELGLTRDAADALRLDYWQRYGTTLAGLIAEHGVDPDPFLQAVHTVELHALTPEPALADALAELPGRRIVYTNGSAPYAARVLAARGLDGLFDAVFGVEHAAYRSKPERQAFDTVFALAGIETATAAMFEDDPRNLHAPHALGMRTVLVGPERLDLAHIHHHTNDLAAFLGLLRPVPVV